MRFLFALGFGASLLSSPLCSPAQAQETPSARAVDIAHSRAAFSVTHIFVSHVNGEVPLLAASITLPPNTTLPTSVSATLDPTRIETHDPDRNESLQGPDWFDTKRFPTWSFTSTSISPGPQDTFTVSGLLTIHGVAQSLTLNVKTVHGLPNPAYHASGRVDRHGFGMRTLPVDGTIGNDVDLSLDIQAKESTLDTPLQVKKVGVK